MILSQKMFILLKEKQLSSNKYSTIKDNNFQIYNLDEFVLFSDRKILKGKILLLSLIIIYQNQISSIFQKECLI